MSEILDQSVVHDAGASPNEGPATTSRRSLNHLLTGKFIVGVTLVLAITLFGLLGPFFVQDPRAVSNLGLTPPGVEHLFGTTQTGQDVLGQLAHATRGSLLIGMAVGVMALVLSAFFGILGAYMGGIADDVFSLITNVMLIIPGLPLMIVIGSYVPQKSIWLVAVVLALTSWAASARVLRAQTLSLRSRDYVLASRVAGERSWRIISVEILPNLLPVMSSGFVFAIVFAILGEAGLSFIGIGVSDTLTWGTMLAGAQNGQALLLGGWWWFVPPGLMIALLGCGLSLINFSIDEVINPKLRTRKIAPVKKIEAKA